MKKESLFGIVVVIFGAFIAVVPQYIFPVCTPTEIKIMKCVWMAKAELGVGLVIVAVGLSMFLFKGKGTAFAFGLSTAFLSLLALALPTVLIGVCKTATMPCVTGTLPALIFISSLLFLLSVIFTAISYKSIK